MHKNTSTEPSQDIGSTKLPPKSKDQHAALIRLIQLLAQQAALDFHRSGGILEAGEPA